MSRKRLFKILKRTFVILFVLGLLFIHFVVPRVLTEKRSALKSFFKEETVYNYDHFYNDSLEFKRKRVNITSFDSTELSGYITYSKLPETKGTVILLPSSGNNKYSFIEVSKFLSNNGYNSVAMDLRGFGESEGKFATYGYKEKKDVQSVLDYLIKNENLDNFGIWGQSLGAAIAMQAMGIEPRLKYGIVESTFTDFKTSMYMHFLRGTGVKLRWFTNYIINRSGKIGDFDADDISPIKYAKNITQPIIVVHGENDPVFKIEFGKANYDEIKSADKEFIEIKDAAHTDIWKVGGKKYFDKVLSFLDEQSTKTN